MRIRKTGHAPRWGFVVLVMVLGLGVQVGCQKTSPSDSEQAPGTTPDFDITWWKRPVRIVAVENLSYLLLTDQTHLYWMKSDCRRLFQRHKVSGSQRAVVKLSEGQIVSVVLGSNHIFWTTVKKGPGRLDHRTTLWRVPKGGGPQEKIRTLPGRIGLLTRRAGTLYLQGHMKLYALPEASPTSRLKPVLTRENMAYMKLDDQYAYWVEGGGRYSKNSRLVPGFAETPISARMESQQRRTP